MEMDSLTELRKIAATIRSLDDQLRDYETGFDVEAHETDTIADAREGLQNASLALSRFRNNEVEEAEPTPEQQYQPTEPRRWQVGDLFLSESIGRCIVLSIDFMLLNVVSERIGYSLDLNDHPERVDHNTGLQYQYESREQVQREFKSGYFTPYFEIL